jgi:hypothetical protein
MEMTKIIAPIDQLFAPWNKPDSPDCVIAKNRNSKIVYQRGYGMANLEYDLPITPNSVFDIGSTSKQFTAIDRTRRVLYARIGRTVRIFTRSKPSSHRLYLTGR